MANVKRSAEERLERLKADIATKEAQQKKLSASLRTEKKSKINRRSFLLGEYLQKDKELPDYVLEAIASGLDAFLTKTDDRDALNDFLRGSPLPYGEIPSGKSEPTDPRPFQLRRGRAL